MNELGDFYLNIVGKSTAGKLVKSGVGGLASLVINKGPAAGTIGIYDSLTGSGTKIGTITIQSTTAIRAFPYNACVQNGLTITTSSSLFDLTVTYR